MLNVQFSLPTSLARGETLRGLAAWRSFTRSQFQDFHPFKDRLEMQMGL
jgi:hypothetical protein